MLTRARVWRYPRRGVVVDNSYRIEHRAEVAVVGPTVHRMGRKILFLARRVACTAIFTNAALRALHVTRTGITGMIRHRTRGPISASTVAAARSRMLASTWTTVSGGIKHRIGDPIRLPMGGGTDLAVARMAARHAKHGSGSAICLPVRANAWCSAGVPTSRSVLQRIPLAIAAAICPPVRRDTRHTIRFGTGVAACNATCTRARQPVVRTAC